MSCWLARSKGRERSGAEKQLKTAAFEGCMWKGQQADAEVEGGGVTRADGMGGGGVGLIDLQPDERGKS